MSEFVKKSKKFIQRKYKGLNSRLFEMYDASIDRKICGKSLVKYVPSIYREDDKGVGFTGSQSTFYSVLKVIFKNVTLTEEDKFLDVGCGKGRVLAYLIHSKAPCKAIDGVEINEPVGKLTQEWSSKYDKVNVTIGDAFKMDFDKYTVLFLGRPFLPKTFAEFLDLLEGQLTHPITFIYWVDQQSGYMLKDRAGWTMLEHGVISKIHGLYCVHVPQGYSVWTYEPNKK